ncbi:MAG: hypothetical protein K6B14_02615 [Lachnospiraceae bacterium]|nr:hypothetical protein [Lachnospiraceae bacterium]
MNIVAHNLQAMNTSRQLNIVSTQKAKSTEKLASGYKINRAADDAAGLSISEKMRWNIRGLDKASNNIMDGISLVQTAEGALNEVHVMLERMKELTVQAANDTNTEMDRGAIQSEIDEIKQETDRIFNDTTYNTMPVFRKKLEYIEYTDPGHTIPIGGGSEYVEGNNYGLVSVLNQNGGDNITTESNLADRVTLSGDGWVTSGNSDPRAVLNEWHYDSNGKKITSNTYGPNPNDDIIFTTDFGSVPEGGTVTIAPDVFTRKGNTLVSQPRVDNTPCYDNKGQQIDHSIFVTTISLSGNGEGNAMASGYTTRQSSSSGVQIAEHQTYVQDSAGVGGSYRKGGTYACSYMDFSGMGSSFHKSDLVGLGFSSVCSHGCRVHYSVEFVDNSSGSYSLPNTTGNGVAWGEKTGQSKLIQIDLSSISDDPSGAAKLVAGITEATKASLSFDGHYEQYAYNTSNPAKLYLYENTLNVKSGERSTWEPTARDENGEMPPLRYSVGKKTYTEADDLHIQSSSIALQAIIINRPVMTNNDLGINSIYVDDFATATASVDVVDGAMDYVSDKRAYLGAMQNRMEHAYAVDRTTAENTQYSESRIRDTDIAKEMVDNAAKSIIEQAGQSILAQANQTQQGVLSLLQ